MTLRFLPLFFLVSLAGPALGQTEPERPATSQPTTPGDLGTGWLGVGLVEVGLEQAKALGYRRTLVATDRIFPASPAIAANLVLGDIILSFDDSVLKTAHDLVTLVQSSPPGRQVVLSILRDGRIIAQPIMLGARPEFESLLTGYFQGSTPTELSARSSVDDTPVNLADYRGKVVVLEFWATWCGPCVAMIPTYNELSARYVDLEVVAITNEPPDVLRTFLSTRDVEYVTAYDVDEETTRNYWITAYPTSFLLDRDGVIRHVHIGAGDVDDLEARIGALLEEVGQ